MLRLDGRQESRRAEIQRIFSASLRPRHPCVKGFKASLRSLLAMVCKALITADALTEIKNDQVWEAPFNKGHEEGFEKGHRVGREDGREEGSFERAREIALSMQEQGMDAMLIARIIGLDVEEIQSLENRDSIHITVDE